jgi:hypothetical protein
MAVGWGQFGNPGRETSTVGSRYQKTGERQQIKKTKCMFCELQTDCVIW